jgi:hypothetical protein
MGMIHDVILEIAEIFAHKSASCSELVNIQRSPAGFDCMASSSGLPEAENNQFKM